MPKITAARCTGCKIKNRLPPKRTAGHGVSHEDINKYSTDFLKLQYLLEGETIPQSARGLTAPFTQGSLCGRLIASPTKTNQNGCFDLKGGALQPRRGNRNVFKQGGSSDDVAMGDNIKAGGQWAILPAMVRYDPKLPANAKLIYAEIAAKINEEGYCFASNRYFAERFKLKEDTVSGLVRRLADAEYISVDLDTCRQNRDKRRIYLTGKPYDFQGIGFKSDTGKTSGTVSDLNPGPIENNNIKIIPPVVPRGGQPPGEKKSRREKTEPDWKPERFEAFWNYYPPVNGKRPCRQRAVKAWDKLRPDDETIARMGRALRRELRSEMWQKGVGIPYASSWLNQRRWEDEIVDNPSVGFADSSLYTREPGGWAETGEVF